MPDPMDTDLVLQVVVSELDEYLSVQPVGTKLVAVLAEADKVQPVANLQQNYGYSVVVPTLLYTMMIWSVIGKQAKQIGEIVGGGGGSSLFPYAGSGGDHGKDRVIMAMVVAAMPMIMAVNTVTITMTMVMVMVVVMAIVVAIMMTMTVTGRTVVPRPMNGITMTGIRTTMLVMVDSGGDDGKDWVLMVMVLLMAMLMILMVIAMTITMRMTMVVVAVVVRMTMTRTW